MTLYDRIKKIAVDKNISISSIEENAKISNGSIIKWKQNIPKADNLYRVASFLGCSVEFLMTGSDNNIYNTSDNNIISKESPASYSVGLTQNEIEILNILRKFSDCRNQIKFIARAEDIAKEMLSNIAENKI